MFRCTVACVPQLLYPLLLLLVMTLVVPSTAAAEDYMRADQLHEVVQRAVQAHQPIVPSRSTPSAESATSRQYKHQFDHTTESGVNVHFSYKVDVHENVHYLHTELNNATVASVECIFHRNNTGYEMNCDSPKMSSS